MHRISLLLPILVTPLLVGCASEPKAEATPAPAPKPSPVTLATWTPDAEARVVTVDRESAFTVVEADRDLFVLRTRGYLDGRQVAQVVWILCTPPAQDGPARYPISLASHELDHSGASERGGDQWQDPPHDPRPGTAIGWAVIDRDGRPRTTSPISGEIEILSLDTDHAGISVRLETRGVDDVLVFEGECMRIDRPRPIETPALATRSGLPHRAPEKEEPSKTDPVWPWNEIFKPSNAGFRGDK